MSKKLDWSEVRAIEQILRSFEGTTDDGFPGWQLLDKFRDHEDYISELEGFRTGYRAVVKDLVNL